MSSAPSGLDEEKTIGLPAVPNGSMAIQQLCDWIEKATPDLQNSVVTDISWWADAHTLLRHQFLLLRFDHAGRSHELVLERAGKVIWSPLRLAIDRATFRAPGADKSFYKTHKLKFALLTDRSIAPEGLESHCTRISSLNAHLSKTRTSLTVLPTFWTTNGADRPCG
jgi:hypothetical protein